MRNSVLDNKELSERIKRHILSYGKTIPADDIIQDARVKYFLYDQQGKVIPGGETALFFTISKNLMIDYLRYKKDPSTANDICKDAQGNLFDFAEEYIQEDPRIDAVNSALEKINVEEKEILLELCSGTRSKEIAKRLNVSDTTIRLKKFRAVRNVRKLLEA